MAPRGRAPALAALVLLVAGAGGAVAGADPPARVVRCGEVLTADVRLAEDVTCAGDRGLVVAADGVDVDLDGHVVTGPGLARGPSAADVAGVGISVEAEGVTVRGGRVSGWDTGVRAGGPGGPGSAVLRDVRLEVDGTGAHAGAGGSLRITSSVLRSNTTGALAEGSLVVAGSLLEGNLTGVSAPGPGRGGSLTLRSNLLRFNDIAVLCQRPGLLVEASTLVGNDSALTTSGCAPWTVRASAFRSNGLNLWVRETRPYTVECTSFDPRGGPAGVPVRPCPPGSGAPPRGGTPGS